MICESHVHIGQFYETYISPQNLIEILKPLNLDRYAVSSTTVCQEEYSKVIQEFEYLLYHDDKRIDPVLWLTPSLLSNEKSLKIFLESGISWKCIKLHPYFHPEVWINNSELFQVAITLAKELVLPLLIHTGGYPNADIEVWDSILPKYKKQIFIFAHCRPFNQAVYILQKHPNAYGDLAFVDENDFPSLISDDIWKKILWGSDVPINKYFLRDISTKDYYKRRIRFLKEFSSAEQLDIMLFKNYINLLKP